MCVCYPHNMTKISMQVGCGCEMKDEDPNASPSPCDDLYIWDGPDTGGGFVKGRRYLWQCRTCKVKIGVNLTLLEEEE